MRYPQKPVDINAKDARVRLFDCLYEKYESCGKVDYNFTVRKISNELKWNPYQIFNSIKKFREHGLVIIEKQRSRNCLWRTNFGKRKKEEIFDELFSV